MIREAFLTDISQIRKMAKVVFPMTYSSILSPEQLDYMMEWMYSEDNLREQMTERGDRFFIDDSSRGYVSFRHDHDNIYHLEKIYVLPESQKSGLGRKLFNRVIDEIRLIQNERPFTVELNVNRNNPSVGFYRHLGMRCDRTGDFPIGKGYYMNDYIMAIDFEK